MDREIGRSVGRRWKFMTQKKILEAHVLIRGTKNRAPVQLRNIELGRCAKGEMLLSVHGNC
jgi:hypothetical protein